MKNTIKIQSFSDVITNSSSELFLFKSDETLEELQKMVNMHYGTHCWYDLSEKEQEGLDMNDYNCGSGMGGDHDVIKFKVDDIEYYELDKEKFQEYSGGNIDNLYILDIDWSSHATIKWAEETFQDIVRID